MADKMTDRQKQDAHNARKVARRAAEKSGAVKKGDGKDVDHKKPLSKGGSTLELPLQRRIVQMVVK